MPESPNSSRRGEAIKLRKGDLTYAEIGRRLGVTKERARQIIKGETRANKKPAPDNPDALLTPGQGSPTFEYSHKYSQTVE